MFVSKCVCACVYVCRFTYICVCLLVVYIVYHLTCHNMRSVLVQTELHYKETFGFTGTFN